MSNTKSEYYKVRVHFASGTVGYLRGTAGMAPSEYQVTGNKVFAQKFDTFEIAEYYAKSFKPTRKTITKIEVIDWDNVVVEV